MKIRDVMTTAVRSAQLDTSIEELATIMRDEDVGSVPILDNGELVGIITDRDVVVRCIAEGRNSAEATVADILRGDLMIVSPTHETEEAARIMADLQVRRLPVVEGRKLVGMVSIGDLAVKSDTGEEQIGRTLEEVSEGVKASGSDAARAKRSGIPTNGGRNTGQQRQNANATREESVAKKPPVAAKPKRQQPGSSTQTTERGAKVRGRKSAAVTGGGRQETMKSESGRRSGSTRGRVEAKGKAPRKQKSAAKSTTSRSTAAKKKKARVLQMGSRTSSRSQKRKAS